MWTSIHSIGQNDRFRIVNRRASHEMVHIEFSRKVDSPCEDLTEPNNYFSTIDVSITTPEVIANNEYDPLKVIRQFRSGSDWTQEDELSHYRVILKVVDEGLFLAKVNSFWILQLLQGKSVSSNPNKKYPDFSKLPQSEDFGNFPKSVSCFGDESWT